jgi:hypothetical protein
MDRHKCDCKEAKKLVVAKSVDIGYDEWLSDNCKDKTQEVINLEVDYKLVMGHVWKVNGGIIDDVLACDPEYFRDYADNEFSLLNAKKRTCMSLFYQTIERHFQEGMIDFLVNERLFKLEDIIPCQDGFMIPKARYYDDLLKDIESIQLHKWGFIVPMAVKPFDEAIDIPIDNVLDPDDVFNNMCVEFEKSHAKIINTASYVKETENEVILFSKEKLRNAYEHISYMKLSPLGILKPTAFVYDWTECNDNIRKYDNVGVYPNGSRVRPLEAIPSVGYPFEIAYLYGAKGDF